MSSGVLRKQQTNGKSRPASGKQHKTEQADTNRKSLQTLQKSADDQLVLVGSLGMVKQKGKENEKSDLKNKTLKGNILEHNIEKENSPMMPRRSRRKPGLVDSNNTLLPTRSDNIKLEKLKAADSQKNAGSNKNIKKLFGKAKKNEAVNSKSKLNFFCTDVQSSGNFSEDMGSVSKANTDITVVKEPSDSQSCNTQLISEEHYNLLISDNVPDNYWKELAEQRRIALESALHENELLHDQLEVLETENSKLASMLKDAEKLALAVKDILGEA